MHRHHFSWPLVHLLNSFARQFQEWPRVSYKDTSLCIVITFFDFLSIYWIHSHVNFKNGPAYLIRTPACASSSLFLISCPFIEFIRTSISRMAPSILSGRQFVHRRHFSWPLVHLLNLFPRQFQEWPRVSFKDVSLCIVITFLDLLSIYWIYFRVNFKNGPEYLIRTPAWASSSLFLTPCPFIEFIRTSISWIAPSIIWGLQLVHRHHFSWPLVHLLNTFPRQFQEWPRVSNKDVSLCIVNTFLHLLSIYWIHSHINFKNGIEYLMRTSACASTSLFLTSCPFTEFISASISRMAPSII